MTRWQTVSLGEAVELAYGKNLPKGSRAEGGTIPVYGSNGITGWHSDALVNEPTVIVGRKGSAGAVQYVQSPCYPIDTTYFVRPRPGFRFDTKFLFYQLSKLDLSRLRTATGVPGLTREDAYREQIRIPPIDEQRRIVDLLSRAEGIVKLRSEAKKMAAELIPAIFMDMFGDPATNPKGWPAKPLVEVASFMSGGTPPKAREDLWLGTLPWVSPKDMKVDCIVDAIDHVSDSVLTETNLKLVPIGSILIVVRGMILVHTVPIAITSTPVTINQDMKALMPIKSIDPSFLLWALKVQHPKLLGLVDTAAHGTKKLDTAKIQAVGIPVPPLQIQRQFIARADSVASIIAQQDSALNKARATFEALLARSFTTEALA